MPGGSKLRLVVGRTNTGERRPVGLGHNQPPAEIDSTQVEEVREATLELKG